MARIPESSMHIGAKEPSGFAIGDDERLAEELAVIEGNVFNGETVDGVFRGQPGGLSLLAVTNRRIMMVDTAGFEDRCAVMSLPLKSVSGVGFLAGPDESLMTTATVGIKMGGAKHLLICRTEDEARQLHDMIIWAIT
jgi:hypothetical protein